MNKNDTIYTRKTYSQVQELVTRFPHTFMSMYEGRKIFFVYETKIAWIGIYSYVKSVG